MCGYLIYPFKPRKDLLSLHLERQKHRGEDGYGAIALKFPSPSAVRSTKHLKKDEFLKKMQYMPTGPQIIHHRKASIGGIKSELVHPLLSTDKKVMMMQNGTKRDLSSMFFEASDTKALAEYWNRVDDDALYCLLDGTGVVIAIDEGRLWFHRDKGRTLYKCTEGYMEGMYASEPIEEGMWALVDEYVLHELPLNVEDWDLEHGTPHEYTAKECVFRGCTDTYFGSVGQHRCPSCANLYPRTAAGVNNTAVNRRGGHQSSPNAWQGDMI